jgi:DNA-binding FadR family transcriptional regulator
VLAPIAPPKNIHRHTLARLGEAIVAGQYAPGSTIPPEAVLVERFGVSRTVVREAVKSLVAKGLLSTGPKVGTRVLPQAAWNWFDPDVVHWQVGVGVTRDFLRDMQELRRALEPAAVRLAAERATREDVAAIERAYQGMREAIEHGGDYVGHDLAFHLGLLAASRNRMMVQMGKAVGALLRTSFEISTSKPHGPAHSLPLHRAVLDAVIARDATRAERASLVLIDGARDDIEAVLGSRRKLPHVAGVAAPLKARATAATPQALAGVAAPFKARATAATPQALAGVAAPLKARATAATPQALAGVAAPLKARATAATPQALAGVAAPLKARATAATPQALAGVAAPLKARAAAAAPTKARKTARSTAKENAG